MGGGATSMAARTELRCLADSLGRPNNGVMRTVGGFLTQLYSNLDSIADSKTESTLYSGSTNLLIASKIGSGAANKRIDELMKGQH
jgi:hypothetical protein